MLEFLIVPTNQTVRGETSDGDVWSITKGGDGSRRCMTRAITTGYSRQPIGNRVIEIPQECRAIRSRLFAIICMLANF